MFTFGFGAATYLILGILPPFIIGNLLIAAGQKLPTSLLVALFPVTLPLAIVAGALALTQFVLATAITIALSPVLLLVDLIMLASGFKWSEQKLGHRGANVTKENIVELKESKETPENSKSKAKLPSIAALKQVFNTTAKAQETQAETVASDKTTKEQSSVAAQQLEALVALS